MTLGEVIKKYREKIGMSQRQLCAESGLSHSYISILESGKKSNGKPMIPSLITINDIAKALRVPLDDLLGELDEDITFSIKDNDDTGAFLSADETRLLHLYRSLNEKGKNSLIKAAEMHALMPEYKYSESSKKAE